MNKILIMLAVTFLLLSSTLNTMAEKTVIFAGELLAVAGKSPVKEQTIIIEDGKITELRPGYVAVTEFAKDTIFIDLKNSFVLPGLMDMHVHLQFELGPENVRDNLQMSEQLIGMSSMDVIKSATVNAADLLGMSDSIGTIEVGKFADIIATDASPIDNIEELLSVDFVMKGGKVRKQ